MKVLFAMILLMIVATYGCTTDEATVLEQGTSDVVEVGDIVVEELDDEPSLSDVEVSLDDTDIVPTVEEDVEN